MGDFFQNVSRYPRYLISFTLGIFYFLLKSLQPFFSRPVTAIATLGFLVSGFIFLTLTLRAMLGLSAV